MLWKKIRTIVLLTPLLVCSGCTDLENPTVCSSGLVCPPGTTCATNQDTCIVGLCGNGVPDTDAGEVCDDGNVIPQDGCSADCKTVGWCGDGLVNELDGEECDDRGASEDCDADCTFQSCGDQVINPLAGELCDDGGNSPNCDEDCSLRLCGDHFANAAAGEQCDEGAILTETCDTDCTFAECGDGVPNPLAGEACDDGNLVNTDQCNAACKSPSCANGNQDGDETDIDCGGRCGATCEMLQTCSTSDDCAASAVCVAGTCIADGPILATGGSHTCARLNTGSVRCWGNGDRGQLGYRNTDNIGDDETPASRSAVNVGGSVIQLAAGGSHTCALLDTGSVRCWGNGGDGQLGYGCDNYDCDIGDDETPASAGDVDIGGTVIQLAAGGSHTCALLDSGSVRCWGDGSDGQLGYGNYVDSVGLYNTPAEAGDVTVGGSVIQLAAGGSHTCALLDSGSVRCWGDGSDGQLGYDYVDSVGLYNTPAEAGDVAVGGSVIQLAAGGSHTCALLDSASVRCWGDGQYGQLGYGNTSSIGDNETPASFDPVDIGGTVIQIAAGDAHTCALLDSGSVRCWGDGQYGRLGYGNTSNIGDNETPATRNPVNVGGTVIQITAGGEHTCALLDSGAVRCWGEGGEGQLGYGNTNDVGDTETPASVNPVDIGGSIIPGAAGLEHAGALPQADVAQCWNNELSEHLGYGNEHYIDDGEV